MNKIKIAAILVLVGYILGMITALTVKAMLFALLGGIALLIVLTLLGWLFYLSVKRKWQKKKGTAEAPMASTN